MFFKFAPVETILHCDQDAVDSLMNQDHRPHIG